MIQLTFNLNVPRGTNFDGRLTKEQAESLVKLGVENIMCKEYGDDEDWVAVTADDLDLDTGKCPEDYKTFEIWL